MARPRSLPAPPSNIDSPVKSVKVDVSSADFLAPNDTIITAVNVSVAGVLILIGLDGTTLDPEYFNTGWNPCTCCSGVRHSGSNTATILKAKLAVITFDF